jgi:hypothetical protein
MVSPAVTFRDATSDTADHVHFPEVVEAFEALGFGRLGRLERVYPEGLEHAADSYAEEHRPVFQRHKAVPMTVLTAEDGTALVLVDWWWGMPDVRIRTAMADGSVVETRRAWDHAPVLPQSLARIQASLDLTGEQTLGSVPGGGREVALATGTPAELWAAHRQRATAWAQAHGTVPALFSRMEQAAGLSARIAAHDARVMQRIRRVQLAVLAVVYLVPLLVLLGAVFGGPMSWTAVAVILVGLGLWVVVSAVVCRRLARVRYLQSVRPALVRR